MNLKPQLQFEYGNRVANPHDFLKIRYNQPARRSKVQAEGGSEDDVEHVSILDIFQQNVMRMAPSIIQADVVLDSLDSFLGHGEKMAFAATIDPFLAGAVDFLVGKAGQAIIEEDGALGFIDAAKGEIPRYERRGAAGIAMRAVDAGQAIAGRRRVLATEPPDAEPSHPKRRMRSQPEGPRLRFEGSS